MSILHIIGTEVGSLGEWSSTNLASASSSIKRTGGYSTFLDNSNDAYAQRTFAAKSEVWIRLYANDGFRHSGGQTIATIRDSSETVLATFSCTWSGSEYLLRAQATGGTLQTGTTDLTTGFHQIEIRYKAGSGSNAIAEIKLDGTVEATSNDGTSTADADRVRCHGYSGLQTSLDDVQINDAAYPGAGQIDCIRTNATGDETNWTASPAGNIYDHWSEDPANDSNQAYSGGSYSHLCNLTTVTVGTVNAIAVGGRLHDEGGYAGPANLRCKFPSVEAENSSDLTLELLTTYQYHSFMPGTGPSPIQQSHIDGFQAGANSGQGNKNLYCSEIYVMIDHTGGVAGPTNLKTRDSLAKASIKTVNDLAMASIKTLDGLA